MAERAAHTPLDPIEPVSFTARLVRAPHVAYTEVDGTPVVVAIEERAVQTLTPTWAAAWAALDGRPVAEALGIDPAALDAVAARNLIEVLRRLKAARLICDAGSLGAGSLGAAGPTDPIDEQPVAGELALDLHGRVERVGGGVGLVLEPSNPDTVPLSVCEGDAGVAVSSAGEPVAWVGVSATSYAAPDGSADAVARLQGLVEATVEPDALGVPGAVDLLASVAELATTQPIPNAGS